MMIEVMRADSFVISSGDFKSLHFFNNGVVPVISFL